MTTTSFSHNLSQSEIDLSQNTSTNFSSTLLNKSNITPATNKTSASINFSDYFNDTSSLNYETYSTLSSSGIPLNPTASAYSNINSTTKKDNSIEKITSPTSTTIKTPKNVSSPSRNKSTRTVTSTTSSPLNQLSSTITPTDTDVNPQTPSTAFPSRISLTTNKVVQKYLEEIPPPNPVPFQPNKLKINKSNNISSTGMASPAPFPLADLDDLPYYSISK